MSAVPNFKRIDSATAKLDAAIAQRNGIDEWPELQPLIAKLDPECERRREFASNQPV